MKIAERSKHVQYILKARLDRARSLENLYFDGLQDKNAVETILENLVCTKSNGFRGVVLTALIGMALDETFNPLENFYGCNPRAIFENGIWQVLNEYEIPCGKSDPLNVAKKIQKLDIAWAEGRRPQMAAIAAVDFLGLIVSETNPSRRNLLEEFFYFKVLQYSKQIQSIKIVSAHARIFSRQVMAENLVNFVLTAPESGATPQLLVAQTLAALFDNVPYHVGGIEESVFGTNTTSKKPADIWVENNGRRWV